MMTFKSQGAARGPPRPPAGHPPGRKARATMRVPSLAAICFGVFLLAVPACASEKAATPSDGAPQNQKKDTNAPHPSGPPAEITKTSAESVPANPPVAPAATAAATGATATTTATPRDPNGLAAKVNGSAIL